MSSPLKILITGGSGFLGTHLMSEFEGQHRCLGTFHSHAPTARQNFIQIDLTQEKAVRDLIEKSSPDVIIHTAALTNVDQCEREPDLANLSNVAATTYLMKAIQGASTRFIHISTDQIFDGRKTLYSEFDSPCPVNIYGETKWRAEEVVEKLGRNFNILRTNFYGLGKGKSTFLDWCCKVLREKSAADLYNDVFYTPISINDLTLTITSMLDQKESGIFNVTGNERLSKAEFFQKVAFILKLSDEQIRYGRYIQRNGAAQRPLEMSLSNKKILTTYKLTYQNIETSLKDLLLSAPIG
jgi:dTDP-4-dehydrorhamnose reductase